MNRKELIELLVINSDMSPDQVESTADEYLDLVMGTEVDDLTQEQLEFIEWVETLTGQQ